jgi:hypothetical protein
MFRLLFPALVCIVISASGHAQVRELSRTGQAPGGAGYHVNYDSASHRLFVGCGSSVWVYDTQDTANIHVIARRPLLGLVNETDLYGDVLFVAATHDGVWALDATSDTLSPIAHYEITGDSAAYDMWRTNDTLYVADGKTVRMLKYNSNGSFSYLTSFGPANSFCVARKGNYIAVGAQGIPKGTVMIYQYDYLTVPVAMWQSNNAWDMQDIGFGDLRDDIVYVCGGPQNLLFTQSYFFALQHQGSYLTAIDSFSVPGIIGWAQANINNYDSQNDTLFVSTGAGLNNLLQAIVPVYDATGLPDTNMIHLADIHPGLWHFDVARMHGTPYLAMSSEWLGVLISDVSQLEPEDTLGFLETGGWCQRAYIRGDTLWACMRGYGLVAYELDSLFYHAGYMNDPRILHIFTQFVMDMAFINDTLIILSTGEIYNLKPWFQGGEPAFVDELGVFNMETIRAIETNSGPRVIAGLTNVLLPLRQVALYNPFDSLSGYPILDIDSTNSDINGLFISGDTVFCGKKIENTYYLAMFRVVNDSLHLIDTVPSPGEINGFSRDGSLLAASCGMFRFAWFYIDGNTLVHLGTEFDWKLNTIGIYLKNNLVYVADKFYGLRVYLLTEPPEATLVAECRGTGGYVNLFGSTGVDVGSDGTIYLSDFQAGVIIIEPYDSTLVTFPAIRRISAGIKIIPNPSSGDIRLYIETDKPIKNAHIRILSVTGQEMEALVLYEIRPGSSVPIRLPSLPPGVYILTVSAEGSLIGAGKLVVV